MSPERQERVLQTWEIAIDKTGGYLSSRALLLVFSASFASVAFTLLGLDSAVAIALLFAVIAQLIPVIGTYVGGSVAVLVALANRPVTAIWVVAYIVIYQQVESYLIAPRITSRTMSLHPAIALGSVVAGASVLGVVGTILALPAAAVIQALISSYLQTYDVIESEMTRDEIDQDEIIADVDEIEDDNQPLSPDDPAISDPEGSEVRHVSDTPPHDRGTDAADQ